jgi:hypothetical protein
VYSSLVTAALLRQSLQLLKGVTLGIYLVTDRARDQLIGEGVSLPWRNLTDNQTLTVWSVADPE